MKSSNKAIINLRILLVFLILVIAVTIVTFFWIRSNEQEKITESLAFLKVKDKNLEMMEKSFEMLYEADNDFWLYTLTYNKQYFHEYSDDINALLSTLDSLTTSLTTDSVEMLYVEDASENILKKEHISASFIHMKKLTDSLLNVAVTMDELGFGLYAQKQLRIQQSSRNRMEAQEMRLILTNKALMENLKEIMNVLNQHVEKRNERVHHDAHGTIDKSARTLNLTSLVSLGIVLILLLLISITIRQIIRYQKHILAARRKAEEEAAEKSRYSQER